MKEFRVGKPISIGDMTLTSIERVEVHCDAWAAGVVVWASKAPVALLLSGPSGHFAVTVASEEWRLSDLLGHLGGQAEDMLEPQSRCDTKPCGTVP